MLWGYVFANPPSPFFLLSHASAFRSTINSLAEITTITLCATFPSLPQSFQLLRDRFSLPQPPPHPPTFSQPPPFPSSSPSSLPSPIKRIRKSKIFKVDNAKSSLGIGKGDVSVMDEGVDMHWLKSPYRSLGGEAQEEGKSGEVSVVRDLGSKKTVGIQRPRTDMKSWAASFV